MQFLDFIDLKKYWLSGKLNNIISCKTSNLYKLLNFLNNEINNLISYINRLYYSIYPCYPFLGGNELLLKHELELGIPDNLFRQLTQEDIAKFTYTFPLPFYDDTNIYESENITNIERQRDIFVKKYLMFDNSQLGFKRIAGCYGYSIKIEYTDNIINNSFTYTLPLAFGGENIGKITKITVYGNPTLKDRYKLNAIFNYINRIDIKLDIVFSEDDNIYNPKDYCLCGNF